MKVAMATSAALDFAVDTATNYYLSPHEWQRLGVPVHLDGKPRNMMHLVGLGLLTVDQIRSITPDLKDMTSTTFIRLGIEAIYSPLIQHQQSDIDRYRSVVFVGLQCSLPCISSGSSHCQHYLITYPLQGAKTVWSFLAIWTTRK